MTNTRLSTYIGMSQTATKKIFEPIREAFEEVGIGEINREIPELYMNGTKPVNFEYYLNRLDATKLLIEQGGYNLPTAEAVLKTGLYDTWTMLLAATQYFLGQEITEDFETLVLNPADEYMKIQTEADKRKDIAIAKARKTISAIATPLRKVRDELENVEAWMMSGTDAGSIGLDINLLIESIERMEA